VYFEINSLHSEIECTFVCSAEMHPTKRHQATRRALARYRQNIDALILEQCRAAALFDERRGYETYGCGNTVEWLMTHLGMSRESARGKLAIGRLILMGERRMAPR